MAEKPVAMTLLIAVFYVGLLLVKLYLSHRYLSNYPAPDLRTPCSETTLLQPILSGDPFLTDTLKTNIIQLTMARFLWLVDSDDNAAQAICADLRLRYPQRAIEVLLCPTAPDGTNPKLHKLALAMPHIQTSLIVILDDDTQLDETSFRALIAALDQHDLATALPHYVEQGNLPSRLVARFVNDNAVLTYLPLPVVHHPITINGMCYAMRHSRLNELGGFEPLLHHLTDDLALAQRVLRAGGSIRQIPYLVNITTTVRDTSHYMQLMHRWYLFALLLLSSQPTPMKAIIGFFYGLPPLLLWGLITITIFHPSIAVGALLVSTLTLRAIALKFIQKHIAQRDYSSLMLSLVSELLQPFHCFHALCKRCIVWRTRRYIVHDNSHFSALS